ncbi:MAG: peptidylprolyl isomerase [Granulosicoccus sp.]
MLNHTAQIAKALVLTVSAALPVNAIAQSSDENLPEGVLASVNGRPIPQISVDNVAQQIVEAGQEADPARILDELINLEVLTQAAEELNLDKEPEISATLQLQYTQTMANAYLARKSADMTFTEEELRAEYEAQSENVDRGEFKASHILLESSEDALKVLAELDSGKPFADAAAEHSIDPAGEDNGGDLGWFVGSTMVPEFAAAIATMEVGEISKQPVQSEFGYHIIYLVDKRDAALPDFNSVKSGLTNLAVRRALAEHVDALKATANIKTQ